LRMNEKSYGAEPIITRLSRGNLARNLCYQERNAEAEGLLRESIALNEKVLGPTTYTRANNISSRLDDEVTPFVSRMLLANTLRDQRKYTEAAAQYKEIIQLEEKVVGPEQRDTLNACYHYAYQLAEQGQRNEAKLLAERAAKGAAKVLGPNDPYTLEYVKFLEILENGEPITTPYMKFHETFLSGKKT
jgi:tetratricopeptide (TPR) repeat protein